MAELTSKDNIVTIDAPQQLLSEPRRFDFLRALYTSPVGLAGFIIVTIVVFFAIFGTMISPFDPAENNLRARFQPPGFVNDDGATHILGTDQLGRDILSRIIAGSRVSVIVGVVAVMIAGTIGVLYGLIAGFFGGTLDAIMMRMVDALLSIPFIILVVAISGVVGAGLTTLILILGFTGWVTYARVIRGEVLKVRELEYVTAAYAIGQRRIMVMFKQILPNVISTGIILAATQVGVTILAESSLSFLGLGVKPPEITWGLMLADGRQYMGSAWWMTTFPGLAITITVLGVVFLGDWLRDVLDPNVR
ncbi:MAG: ABC transporter permease [Anaerolineaceae bacterium]|nr:MAG: ABC transporter permease [Anaerolineaceae bacterium]